MSLDHYFAIIDPFIHEVKSVPCTGLRERRLIRVFKSINEERKTFSRKVVEHIHELLASGQLKPGDKLPSERELAEMMNVSRPTIREAFKILSAMNLLNIRQGHGVFVADQSARLDNLASLLFLQTDTIYELFEVRKMIETESAAKAAKRGTSDFLDQIYDTTQDCYNKVIIQQQFQTKEERDKFLSESDQQFHLAVAEAAGNEVVMRVMTNLIDLLRESRMQSMKIPGRVEQSLKEHMLIAEAIKDRNAKLARSRMFEHLSSVERTLLHELELAGVPVSLKDESEEPSDISVKPL
jgi:GntR family transcriptional repressor for pyruvate dehydrogenase complex